MSNSKSFGGSWSDEKLKALRAYLQAYTTALKNTPFKLAYIDAFAGAGIREVYSEKESEWFEDTLPEEDASYRHGSPLIALATDPPFHAYFFIERDEASLTSLKHQIESSPENAEKKITYLAGDANSELQKLIDFDWIRSNRRAVAFLDPFALHVEWKTIEKIAATNAIDMWLLFPASAVNRMLPRSGVVPEKWVARLNQLFGNEDWESTFYLKEDPDMFNEEVTKKTPAIFEVLSDYVTKRLGTVFSGTHKKPLILKNNSGAPLFLLCFACGNPKGASIATRIASDIIKTSSHGQ